MPATAWPARQVCVRSCYLSGSTPGGTLGSQGPQSLGSGCMTGSDPSALDICPASQFSQSCYC